MTSNNRSVLRAISILKAFHLNDEFISVSEVSRRAKLPFASTYRLLHALQQTGAVEKGPAGAFRLGFLIASLASNVDLDDCLYKAALGLMNDFSQKFGATLSLGRLQGDKVLIVCRALSPTCKQKFATVGSQLPAYNNALGRVMLADMPDRDVDLLVKEMPVDMAYKSKLVSDLALTRKSGFAVVREELYIGLGCVAIPVQDYEGRVVAAISASQKVEKLTPERIAFLRAELTKIASVIMKNIIPEFSAPDRKAASGGKRRAVGTPVEQPFKLRVV